MARHSHDRKRLVVTTSNERDKVTTGNECITFLFKLPANEQWLKSTLAARTNIELYQIPE
jgi:hypothetical protein